MTSAQSGAGPAPDGPEEHQTPCAECDPGLLDHLKCRAAGIQAQADYNKAHEDDLTKARADYDGARSAYGAARSAAQPKVDDLRKQLSQVIDQLKCLVDNEHKIHRLNRAWRHVEHRLRDCDPNEGCMFDDDCDFDDAAEGCRPEDIGSVIADIERRTAAAVTVFADLIAEPANLTKRVDALKAEVDNIVTQMASDSRSVDFKALYAAALVARYHLDTIWRGFEHVNAYVNCLCRALTCQLKGYTAVSHLKGRQAVHQCHKDQDAAACQQLKDHTADEVMAEYIRLRSESHSDKDYGDRDDNRPGDHDHDRGHDQYGDRDRDRDHDRDGDRDHDRDGDRDHDRDHDRDGDRDRESGGGRYGYEERGRS